MFEAKFDKAATLKRIVDALSFLNEVNFECTTAGIAMQALDPAHVALVSLLISQDGFEMYRCDRPMTLGLNLESLGKILKCAGNEDSLTLRADDGGDRLTFLFEFKNRVSEFGLTLNEIELDKLTIPDSDYAATVKMPSGELQKIITSLTTLGDAVTVDVQQDGVQFNVAGPTSGSIKISQTGSIDDDAASTTITRTEDISLSFAMRYLGYFTKATNLSASVSLSLSADVPLCVEYQIDDAGSSVSSSAVKDETTGKKKTAVKSVRQSRGYIRYYLAPKIDDE